jgi:hypothetical protein
LLPRRLSAAGCVIAGHQLAAQHKALAEKKIKLVKEVEARCDTVAAATEAIVALGADDATMTNIDRGADRFIGGFDGAFAEIERLLDHGDVLPLTAAEQDRRETARALRARLFPNGTDFIRATYRTQWERMNAVHVDAQKPENAAAIKKLGLTLEAERLGRWVALYGAKLGVTEAQDEDLNPDQQWIFKKFLSKMGWGSGRQDELARGLEPLL